MKKLLLAGLILILGGVAIGYYMWNKAPDTVNKKKPDYVLDATALLADFQKDANAANTKYHAKVLQVTGTIVEIVPGKGLKMQVVLGTDGTMSRVSCVMEEHYERFLERKLQKGNTVTIKGFCSGMQEGGGMLEALGQEVILDRCVIVTS